MKHEKFSYNSLNELRNKIHTMGLDLPLSEDLTVLGSPVPNTSLTNRFCIQPMEGCDGTPDGKPGELTKRRYRRFAAGGAALVWFEAVAVVPQGRANPRQLLACDDNLDSFARLVDDMRETAEKSGQARQTIIMQATHSGRYSKPNGTPEPIVAYNNPIFEGGAPLSEERIISDDALKQLEERYGIAAAFAQKAGFDGVDIKCCHGYLCGELLSAYTRRGEYGGDFEGRTKLLLNGLCAAAAATSGSFSINSRLGIFDDYPNGFGVKRTEQSLDGVTPTNYPAGTPDLGEPLRLIEVMKSAERFSLLNITMGNPYQNPHVNRPYDMGGYTPPEHPLYGVARVYGLTRQVKGAFPKLNIVSSAPTYLRQYSANLAAGAIAENCCDIVGFGRQGFAYPDFANDFLKNGEFDKNKCCIACGKCTELMRAGGMAGCVIRDRECYKPAQNLQK